MKVVFVHGALVFDGVAVGAYGGTPCRTRHGQPGRGAAQLRPCSGRLWRGYGRHVRRRRGGPGERSAPRLRGLRDARVRRDDGELRRVGACGTWMDTREEDGTMGIKAELAPEAFMQDCDEAAVAGALERLTRQPLAVFGQAPRAVAWREKPSTYVVCAEDRATPPEAQRGYARRAGKVVELPTGHHPMLSHPELLARVIAEAVAPGG